MRLHFLTKHEVNRKEQYLYKPTNNSKAEQLSPLEIAIDGHPTKVGALWQASNTWLVGQRDDDDRSQI